MYKQILGLIIISLFASKIYSACTAIENPVIFNTALTKALSDNSFRQFTSQYVNASFPQPIAKCDGKGGGPSKFIISPNSDLSISSPISKNEHTYFQIPARYITPTPTFNLYVAFSVKDNQNDANEIWVEDPAIAYTLYTGTSDTRGIRLENVSLLISGIGNAQGQYTINNLRLGLFTAAAGSQIANTTIKLSNSTFRITKTTCVMNGGAAINVMLPTVRTNEFTSIGKTLGETAFTVNVSGCDASDVNKNLMALLTDSSSPGNSSNLGLLKNTALNGSQNVSVQIIDNSDLPIKKIAPKNIASSDSFFNFGTIGTGETISKVFKARYYSNAIPVPATEVKAQAIITLIYN